MTPEEIRAAMQEEERLINGWHQSLSTKEAIARTEARLEDIRSDIGKLEEEDAAFAALLWMCERQPQEPPLRVLATVRAKPTRTLEEAEALNTWDRFIRRRLY